jgi:hypothetical protein
LPSGAPPRAPCIKQTCQPAHGKACLSALTWRCIEVRRCSGAGIDAHSFFSATAYMFTRDYLTDISIGWQIGAFTEQQMCIRSSLLSRP